MVNWETEEQRQKFEESSERFDPEEMTILVLTGAEVFSGAAPLYGKLLWSSCALLPAWTEEGNPDIHRDEVWLDLVSSDGVRKLYKQNTPPDAILRCRVRTRYGEICGRRFLLLDLPEPASHPKLEAMLKRQMKKRTLTVEGVGDFLLNRESGWFEGTVDWLEQEVQLTFEREKPGKLKHIQEAIQTLLANAEMWDRRVRTYAAGELLDVAGIWAENAGGTAPGMEFMDGMKLEAIQIQLSGGFDFWFDSGELFGDHSINVSGNLTDGPDYAALEG